MGIRMENTIPGHFHRAARRPETWKLRPPVPPPIEGLNLLSWICAFILAGLGGFVGTAVGFAMATYMDCGAQLQAAIPVPLLLSSPDCGITVFLMAFVQFSLYGLLIGRALCSNPARLACLLLGAMHFFALSAVSLRSGHL